MAHSAVAARTRVSSAARGADVCGGVFTGDVRTNFGIGYPQRAGTVLGLQPASCWSEPAWSCS